MNNLSKELRTMARENGLCDEWFNEWSDQASLVTLLRKYKKGIDFCIQHDFPSLQYIRDKFLKRHLHAENIFIDDTLLLTNPQGVVVLNGMSNICVVVKKKCKCDIYVRHTSHINLVVEDDSFVVLNLLDEATAMIENNSQTANVLVVKYSENACACDMGKPSKVKVNLDLFRKN